jgi:integrase
MALRFEKLDRPSIRRMKPGDRIIEHGIIAEGIADGDVRYSVNVMVDGRRIHRAIGFGSDGVTRTQCEEFIEQARTDARAGRLALPKGRKLALMVSAAADDYIARLEETGGKNIAIKKRHFRLYLKPFFGAMRLDAISSFSVDRYKKQRAGEGSNPATINRELATLSHLFTMALEWRWIDRLPCRPKKLRESAGRIIALTEQQCDELMRTATASTNPDCWLFVAFGLNTAMRHSEILAARWDKLDLDHLRLFLPRAKAGQREQPITPELADILRREREMRQRCGRPAGSECKLEEPAQCMTHGRAAWIFPSPHDDSKTEHRVRMNSPFSDVVKAAGLDPDLVTPHVMRHTAITKLVKAGVDLPTIQRISGHKTLAMVMRYTHVHGEHIDRAIAALGRTLPRTAPTDPKGPFSNGRIYDGEPGAEVDPSGGGHRGLPAEPAGGAPPLEQAPRPQLVYRRNPRPRDAAGDVATPKLHQPVRSRAS